MKNTPVIHLKRILLGALFVFATLSLRAQPKDDSTFSISPGDVTEATIDTSGRTRLHLTLTPEKGDEFSAFTGRNLNKQVKIVVGGKLRSEPFIRERIAAPSMEIFVSSSEDALATVKALMTSTVTFDQLYKWTDSTGLTHYSEKPPPRSTDQRPAAEPDTEDRNKNSFQELRGSWRGVKATMNGKESRDASLLDGIGPFWATNSFCNRPKREKWGLAAKKYFRLRSLRLETVHALRWHALPGPGQL